MHLCFNLPQFVVSIPLIHGYKKTLNSLCFLVKLLAQTCFSATDLHGFITITFLTIEPQISTCLRIVPFGLLVIRFHPLNFYASILLLTSTFQLATLPITGIRYPKQTKAPMTVVLPSLY